MFAEHDSCPGLSDGRDGSGSGRCHLPGHPGELLGVAAASGLQLSREGFESLAGSD